MKISIGLLACVPAFMLLVLDGSALSAEKLPTTFTITMSDMDCAGCAKKVTAKLTEIEGVAKVETDVEKQTAKVTLKPRAVVSPKLLWEAVEKAKKTPTKIEGPNGILTAKPKA